MEKYHIIDIQESIYLDIYKEAEEAVKLTLDTKCNMGRAKIDFVG